jgi:hypothetical protein
MAESTRNGDFRVHRTGIDGPGRGGRRRRGRGSGLMVGRMRAAIGCVRVARMLVRCVFHVASGKGAVKKPFLSRQL